MKKQQFLPDENLWRVSEKGVDLGSRNWILSRLIWIEELSFSRVNSLSIDLLKNLLLATTMHSTLGEPDDEEKRGEGGEDKGRGMMIDRSRRRGEWRGDEEEDEEDEDELESERGVVKAGDEMEPSRSESSSKCLGSTRKGSLKEKMEPLSFTLWMEIELEGLLMLFTNDNEIERPRPVPSNTRVELVSAW